MTSPKYLYGVVRTMGNGNFGRIGLPTGEEEVYAVNRNGVAAVVSDYQGRTLKELSREELLGQLIIHQKVIETVMRAGTILPAKFGTVLPSSGDVLCALTCGSRYLASALEKFENLVQYEVAVTWESGPPFGEIAGEAEIAALRGVAEGMPPAESLDLRIRIGAMVKESLNRRREELRLQLSLLLREQAVDRQDNALMGDEMLMNEAFLVPRNARQRFLERLSVVDGRYAGKLRLRCVGPLPPYSFGTVEVVRPDPIRVGEALRLLGLDERLSVASVRDAYRRQAAKLHPDINPSPEAADLFPKLLDARTLLMSCCAGAAPDEGRGRTRSRPFSITDLKQLYLVDVKRIRD